MTLNKTIKKVLNEEKDKLDPLRIFYNSYLNQKPIYFYDLILHPTYNKNSKSFMWDVDNPNDKSFNYQVLESVVLEEFELFCKMTNTDYQGYKSRVRKFHNEPARQCYLNDEDTGKINNILKNKKEFKLETTKSMYFIDLNYKSFDLSTYGETIEFYGYFDFKKVYKYDLHGENEEVLTRNEFFNNFDEIFDYWQDKLYHFYNEVTVLFSRNPMFFDNRYDYFELYLE